MGAARSVDKCGQGAKLQEELTPDGVGIPSRQHLKGSNRSVIFYIGWISR
jgi:hypothetical protein